MKLTTNQALQEAVAAHKEGQLQDAERLYRAVLQSQPLHPNANHNLGVLAVSVNKVDAALPFFKNALKASPRTETFWLSYIDALIKNKQFDNAKQVLEQAKKQGLDEEKIHFFEASIVSSLQTKNTNSASPCQHQLNDLLRRYQNKQYDEAEQLALSLTKRFPKHQYSWKVLAGILIQTGRVTESLNPMRKSVQLVPQDPEALYNLGVTLKELGRLDESEESYTRAIALKPDFAEGYGNLGITLKEMGRSDEAEASYARAIILKPDFPEAYSNLGLTLKELHRLDDAKTSCTKAIMLKPEFSEAQNNLGVALKELGRLDEAQESYTRAIALQPDFAEARSNLGTAFRELGRLNKAEKSCAQAIMLNPEFVDAYNNLGITLTELGRIKEAEESYTRAIAIDSDCPEALFYRSRLLFDKGDFEAALRDIDACTLKKARALSLITLYALGRIDEIYKRIEMLSKLDGEDINIAAFAAFISQVKKIPTAYKFCPNPMDFIHVANLSSHLEDSTNCVAGVIEELNEVETVWEPAGKTTVSGFQSLSNSNLFRSPSAYISKLKSIIIDELEAYYLRFKNESCSYIQKWPSKNNLIGWHVILKNQGYQSAHIHSSGWLSGVIYLKVVPSLGNDEGAIEFSLNGVLYSDVSSPGLIFQPQTGDMVFFPSSLHHRTIPFMTDTDRIIISFDLIPEFAEY